MTLAADAAAAQAFGSSITGDETIVGGIRLRFVDPSTLPPSVDDGGVVAWGLDDPAAPSDIDGLHLNVGYSGHGIMASAGGSRMVVDAVLGRLPPATNPFRPQREMIERPLDIL